MPENDRPSRPETAPDREAAVGIFDSGIGGLSVLRHIRDALPGEDLIYFADSGFAPYGEKPESVIAARCMAIADFLQQQRIKLLVVACNSATAAAIQAMRESLPALPLVGVEPGLKPSTLCTRTGVVGVMATAATLSSRKFTMLMESVAAQTGVRFVLQACNGLADAIEWGEVRSPATIRLLRQYLEPLLAQNADTIVLGCTHYPFVLDTIQDILNASNTPPVQIIDTGISVARQTVRRIDESGCRGSRTSPGSLRAYTTGSPTAIDTAFARLLGWNVAATKVEAK